MLFREINTETAHPRLYVYSQIHGLTFALKCMSYLNLINLIQLQNSWK